MLKMKFFQRYKEDKQFQEAQQLVENDKHQCPKCKNSAMEIGFTPDIAQNVMPQRWFKGRASYNTFGFYLKYLSLYGISIINKEYLCVVTCRCPRCGFLEQYAPYMFDKK